MKVLVNINAVREACRTSQISRPVEPRRPSTRKTPVAVLLPSGLQNRDPAEPLTAAQRNH